MIIVLFGGGLGNQMFQYSFGRCLSIKNKQTLKLDAHRYEGAVADSDKGDRIFGLNGFNVAGEPASLDEISSFYKYYKPDTLSRRLQVKLYQYIYAGKPFYAKPYVMEPDENYLNFDSNILKFKFKNVYIRGFWQSEKYFKEVEGVIRNDFSLKGAQSKEYHDMLSKIKMSNSILVLIRRGDFVLLPELRSTYYECPPEFFKKAVAAIADKIENPKIFVVSDGLEWVKKNVAFPYPTEYISHTGFTDNQKIALMSACKHNVVPNSTFAWWGAWLNQNPDKIVITTRSWLLNEEKNSKYVDQLIPESWIKM